MDPKLQEELEKARAEIRATRDIGRQLLTGVLVYGGPMTRRWKKCLEWVRNDLEKIQESTIKSEVYEMNAPLHWAFYLHETRGWLKYDLREMFAETARD